MYIAAETFIYTRIKHTTLTCISGNFRFFVLMSFACRFDQHSLSSAQKQQTNTRFKETSTAIEETTE